MTTLALSDAPLTLAEYRQALDHWQRRAAGTRSIPEAAQCADCIEILRGVIARTEAAIRAAQIGELHLDVSDAALCALACRACYPTAVSAS